MWIWISLSDDLVNWERIIVTCVQWKKKARTWEKLKKKLNKNLKVWSDQENALKGSLHQRWYSKNALEMSIINFKGKFTLN